MSSLEQWRRVDTQYHWNVRLFPLPVHLLCREQFPAQNVLVKPRTGPAAPFKMHNAAGILAVIRRWRRPIFSHHVNCSDSPVTTFQTTYLLLCLLVTDECQTQGQRLPFCLNFFGDCCSTTYSPVNAMGFAFACRIGQVPEN
jgi:hypothetical protein